MSNIDLSQMITAPQRSAAQAEDAAARIKAACRRHILEVADPLTQTNMAAAFAADQMGAQDLEAYRAFVDWTARMRQACRAQIRTRVPDVLEWPDLPLSAADLIRRL